LILTIVGRVELKIANLIPKYFFNRPNTLNLSSLFSKEKPETVRQRYILVIPKF
jgi:hypothetical protein